MDAFGETLNEQLALIREQGLYRELRRIDSAQGTRIQVDGQELLNFSSNDYLGLANDEVLRKAAVAAAERFGVGSGGSRLICGSLSSHHELEEALADFKGTEAVLTFSSGYATALGTITALVGKDDVIVIDKLVHASIVDAARLSNARLRIYRHNDVDNLEKILRSSVTPKRRTLIVTESVFSMDGDLAPLREIVELKDKYGAWLMLDEAHATGLFGAQRRGLAEAFELQERIEIHMGTLGKALGTAGGYICGRRALIEVLVNRARSFIFSTAPSPALAAAATAAVRLVQSEEGETRRATLWARVDHLKNRLVGSRIRVPVIQSAIVPIAIGEEEQALKCAQALKTKGVFVPAIRYPTVARGKARLRVTVTAQHTPEQIEHLTTAISQCIN